MSTDYERGDLEKASKIDIAVTEQQRPSSGDSNSTPNANAQVEWHPGVKARFPWLGFAALLTILLCIAFTVIILVTSNGKVQEVWPGRKTLPLT